ncbi:MAG TPA: HDOD domain-containing protein [Lacunisphaera sp.]|nr:HDOD domain-containing protein [Lacunisphaera sp.]
MLTASHPPVAAKYSDDIIRSRINACPKLASLGRINSALRELVNSDTSMASQIAEIIRRDPSLTARLLRMVNSVYYGLSNSVSNIEEAIFFLGLRQIRELAMATPVIEEMASFQNGSKTPLPWKDLWAHSLGTAILTREILGALPITIDDDTDYLVGLLHNAGKVVMAHAFPEELAEICGTKFETAADVCRKEIELIGWDHGQIGAVYLERHKMSEEIVLAVRHHNHPAEAPRHQIFAAAVQVADCLVRHAGVMGGFEKIDPIQRDAWLQAEGWHILYGADGPETRLARAAIDNALPRLPQMLSGLV